MSPQQFPKLISKIALYRPAKKEKSEAKSETSTLTNQENKRPGLNSKEASRNFMSMKSFLT